jgi:hypothetical protein
LTSINGPQRNKFYSQSLEILFEINFVKTRRYFLLWPLVDEIVCKQINQLDIFMPDALTIRL